MTRTGPKPRMRLHPSAHTWVCYSGSWTDPTVVACNYQMARAFRRWKEKVRGQLGRQWEAP